VRIWIFALSFLLWTACDSVRYGSVPCEGDDCEVALNDSSDSNESSDSGDSKQSSGGQSSENEKKLSSSRHSSSSSAPWWQRRSSSSAKNGTKDTVGVDKNSSTSTHSSTRTSSSSGTPVIQQPVDTLPACDASYEGKTYTLAGVLYYCTAGQWGEFVPSTSEIQCSDGNLKLIRARRVVYAEEADTSETASEYRRAGVRISGVAQKGPFHAGASVKITELDSLKRLAETRRTHETCIASADGSFAFDNLNLVSPYVKVSVNGYYMDELTGVRSTSLLQLDAVVDLSKRDSFNVNILTHLAAPRVLKLVQDAGNNQPIGSQSGRALSDVLSSFGISLGGSTGGFNGGWNRGGTQTASSGQKAAEDLSIFGSDDYSAALLAVSVMLQSYGSSREMLSFASTVASDIQGDGNWGDNSSKARLADKVMMLDAEGGLEKIRRNLESWNLGSVPNFEKYVRDFWTKTHNFETCGTMNAGQVKHVGNSQSAYFVSYYEQPDGPKIRFICDRTTKVWRVATDLEKDTYGLGVGEYDGQIKSGKINQDKSYIYDQSKRSWREPLPGEILEFDDVSDVLKNIAAGEKVIFILRHAERTDDTGKNGHLTDNGKKQSQSVGAKFKGEDIYFANSTYTRSYETCSNVATGAGIASLVSDTIPELDGAWFEKDESKFENYKNSDGGGWVVTSAYAYKGSYSDAFYPLKSRGEEFITEVVKPRFEKVNKVAVWISHDMLVVPLAVFCTDGKVNLRYFDTKQWINYLAGVAIIMGADGSIRYVPVKGLSSGTMTM
jgi:broad specificity phosphatase PhoE